MPTVAGQEFLLHPNSLSPSFCLVHLRLPPLAHAPTGCLEQVNRVLPFQLSPTEPVIPPALVAFKALCPAHHVALSANGESLALVGTKHVQIRRRRDNYAETKHSWKCPHSTHPLPPSLLLLLPPLLSPPRLGLHSLGPLLPQPPPDKSALNEFPSWTKAAWDPSGRVLVLLFNLDEIFLVSKTGSELHSFSASAFNLASGVADLAVRLLPNSEDLCDSLPPFLSLHSHSPSLELFLLGFDRQLIRLIFSVDGSGPIRTLGEYRGKDSSAAVLNLLPLHPAVASLALDTSGSLLIVGGAHGNPSASGSNLQPPLSLWKILDGPESFWEQLHPDPLLPFSSSSKSKRGWVGRKTLPDLSLVRWLQFSPDASSVCLLDLSGSLSVWSVSKRLRLRVWSPSDLQRLFFDLRGPEAAPLPSHSLFAVFEAHWWSPTELALLSSHGQLLVFGNVATSGALHASLAEPVPLLQPLSVIARGLSQRLLLLEVQERVQKVPEHFKMKDDDQGMLQSALNEAAASMGVEDNPGPEIGPKFQLKPFRYFHLQSLKSTTPERLYLSKIEAEVSSPSSQPSL